MPIHVLRHTQIIPAPLVDSWNFFSNPRNLEKITPPELGLTVRHELPPEIYPGQMIEYRVRPLFGVPMTWLTEITHVEPSRYFVDEQRIGPYRLWHHEHHFRALDDGRTEMRDIIHYALKGSPFTEIAHGFLVEPALRRIFEHRERVVADVFTKRTEPTAPAIA